MPILKKELTGSLSILFLQCITIFEYLMECKIHIQCMVEELMKTIFNAGNILEIDMP